MSTLRSEALQVAARLPKGDPQRREILAALQREGEAGWSRYLRDTLWPEYKKDHPKSQEPPKFLVDKAKAKAEDKDKAKSNPREYGNGRSRHEDRWREPASNLTDKEKRQVIRDLLDDKEWSAKNLPPKPDPEKDKYRAVGLHKIQEKRDRAEGYIKQIDRRLKELGHKTALQFWSTRMNLRSKTIRLAARFPKGDPRRLKLLATLKEGWGYRVPVMPRPSYLPPEIRGTDPNVDPQGTDVAAWTWESNGKLYGIAFQGNSNKPLWNFVFRTEAQRDRRIQETITSRKRALELKAQRQKEKSEFEHGLSVGDILYSSWGYDQTNIDFYQVTAVRGKMVEIRKIGGKIVRQSRGVDYVVAVPNNFIGKPLRKKPTGRKGEKPKVKITSYSWASLWDGKPLYQTAAGFGH